MASKAIQGITIKIDGDTTALGNALKDLNKDIRNVDKELKNVDQALKLDPGNAEQVARKLELLGEKSDLAEKKVEALKAAQKQMDAEGVDKSSKAYQELSTEIVKAEGSFKNISTQMERTSQSFDEVVAGSKELDTYLKATGQTADDLTNVVGSKLVDAYKSGQLGAAGFETVLKKVAQEATGSAKNLDEFRNVLKSVDDGASLDQVRQGLEQISSASSGSKTSVSALGAEFDSLKAKTQGIDTELKAVNASLKLDPSSIELCAQKQELLSQAVNTSEQKLQVLRQRYNDFQSGNLNLGEEEFRELQREITNTEASLNGYKSELANLEQAQNRLNTYFEATGTSAKDFANVLGSDLVAKIEKGEASSQELANALDKVGASAVSNKSDLDRLKDALDGLDNGVSLDEVEQEIKSLGTAADEVSTQVDDLGEKLSSIGDTLKGEGLLEASDALGEISEKIVGFGESALDASANVQNATNDMKINLGLTDEAAKEMSEHAQNVYFANYGESLDAVSEAIVFMQQNLDDVNGDNVENLAAQALTVSDVMDVDLKEAVRGVKAMTESYGISSEEAFDMMVRGAQQGLNVSDELGDNLAEYAPLFAQNGYSASEMFSILQAGLDAGAYNLDKVNDLVKEFGIRIADGSIESAVQDLGGSFEETFNRMKESGASNEEMFSALAGEVANLGSEQEKAAAISAIFGTQGEDAGYKVIEAMGKATDTYTDCAGAAQDAADANNNSVEGMQRKWEEFQTKLAPLGEKIAEIGTKILDAIEPIVDWLSNAFSNLSPDIQTFIVVFGGLLAVIGPIAAAIGGLVALLGGPVIAVVVGVCAAIAAVIAIFTNWDSICQQFSDMWNSFCSALGSAWETVWNAIKGAWDSVCNWFTNIFSGLSETVGGAWNSFIQGITDAWNNLWSGIQDAWTAVSGWFSGIFTGISETVGGVWTSFTTGISDAWNSLWTGVQAFWETIAGWFSGIFDGLNLGELWNNVISVIPEAWDTIWGNVQKGWDTVSGWISGAFNGVKDTITGTWNDSKLSTDEAWDNMLSTVSGCSQGMSDESKNQLGQLTQSMGSLWKESLDITDVTWEDMENAVRQQASGMNQEVQDQLPQILSTMKENWEASRSETDSKWTQIKDSVVEKAQDIKDRAVEAWNNVRDKASEAWENVRSTVTQKAEDIRSNLAGKWNDVVSNFSQVWSDLSRRASEIWEDVKSVVSRGVDALKNMMNFHWELPKIALPHFSISGEFSLNPPSIPSISVDWYAKGGILTKPTIFGANGNTLLGGGEAGPEAILPIDKLDAFINENGNSKEVSEKLDTLITLMSQFCQTALNQETQIVLDNGVLVGQLAQGMDRELGVLQKRRIRR